MCTALTSRKEGPSAHLQRHKQAGDGGAHLAPTDPAGWALMYPGLSSFGKRLVTLRDVPSFGRGLWELWAAEYGSLETGVGQMNAGISVVGEWENLSYGWTLVQE